jgi:hypothetical protein
MASTEQQEATGPLLLAHSSSRPEKAMRAVSRADGPVRCLLLAQDYLRLLEWRESLGEVSELVAAGPLIRRAAAELRQPFLDLITDLGRRYQSVAWWASRVSERNTMVSPLFLHCCYLSAAEEQLTPGTICVTSDSWAVLESLADIARARSRPVRWVGRRPPALPRILSLARIAGRVGRFIVQGCLRYLAAPARVEPANLRRPLVLLRTWPDDASFGAQGAFYDRYFPGLHEWLEARGASTLTIPLLSNVRGSYRSAWRRLRRTRRLFLPQEAYYRLSDYVFALSEARRGAAMPKGDLLRLGGLDVSRLFAAERWQSAFDGGSLDATLSYRLPQRLAESGLEPDLVIDAFENMIPEKPSLLGVRRYLPGTKLVGFQHGALYPLLLCNFITAGESEFAPMPDRVVCNGEFFRQILVHEGLPPDRTVVGPALRYAHLWETHSGPGDQRPGPARLLIPLPLVLDAGVELLVKVRLAFAGDESLQVDLKPHPMSVPERLFRAARIEKLPPNFRRVEGSMESALVEARVVVAITSSALYEALAAGKPVLMVGRDAGFDLNPLALHRDLDRVFTDPSEIRSETLRLLALSADELTRYRRRAGQVLRNSFSPVTNEAMEVFVEGLVALPGTRLSSDSLPGVQGACGERWVGETGSAGARGVSSSNSSEVRRTRSSKET